jgi:hypothetical protein
MDRVRDPEFTMAEGAVILQANQLYCESLGEKGALPLTPARRSGRGPSPDPRADHGLSRARRLFHAAPFVLGPVVPD